MDSTNRRFTQSTILNNQGEEKIIQIDFYFGVWMRGFLPWAAYIQDLNIDLNYHKV